MAKVVRKPGPGSNSLKVLLEGLETNKVGKVGFFETAKYPDGTPVAYVATIQEFGSPAQGIRPRSFMRTTISERQESWRRLALSGAKAILAGNENMDTVLDKIGMAAAGDIRRKITQITTPELKPATVAARARRYADGGKGGASNKPLIDTGILLNSVTNSVEDQ